MSVSFSEACVYLLLFLEKEISNLPQEEYGSAIWYLIKLQMLWLVCCVSTVYFAEMAEYCLYFSNEVIS